MLTCKRHTIKPETVKHGTTEHGTLEHPGTSGRTTEHYPEHQQNTPEQQNHAKRRAIVELLRENLKLII